MQYYPINLNVHNRNCLVVGGGAVGTRKVKTLLECGALVTCVSPAFSEDLATLTGDERLTLHQRSYESRDLEGHFLVIGATDDPALNKQIFADTEKRRMLCNIADQPDLCNFILPSIIRRGDLLLAISTSGQSPAFAKALRRKLEMQFGPEYGEFLTLMGTIRQRLLSKAHAPEAHKPLFEQLIDGDLLNLIKHRDHKRIDALLERVLGTEFTYASLTANRHKGPPA